MPWVRIDDHFDEHPKIASVGPLGLALFVSGLAYCNRHLTDGFIPESVVDRLLTVRVFRPGEEKVSFMCIGHYYGGNDPEIAAYEASAAIVSRWLVEAGLWESVDGGYQVHDFLDYQPSKSEVMSEREGWRERKAKSRGESRRDSPKSHGCVTPLPVPVPVPDPVPDPEDEETQRTAPSGLAASRPVVRGRKGTDRLNGNRKECEELAAIQAKLRADIPGLRPLKVDDDMLAAIAKCLEASSFDDCRFVLQSYHDQAKANPEQAKWFNGETNWRLSNFKRTLGQPLPNGGQPHADPVKPVAPRCRQCGGPDPQRSGTYEGVCFSCAFPMSRTSTDRDVHPPRTDHGGSLAQALGALGRPNGNGGGS